MSLIRVTKDGCHEWTGSKFLTGYGRVKMAGRTHRVTRVIWECVNGPIPEGMLLCHHCDNPPCVRLSHLFLGTVADNSRDMVAKGRSSKNETRVYFQGEKHRNAKLTDGQVAEIRERHEAGGTSQAALAREYEVSQALVSQIVRRKHRAAAPTERGEDGCSTGPG